MDMTLDDADDGNVDTEEDAVEVLISVPCGKYKTKNPLRSSLERVSSCLLLGFYGRILP